MVVGPDSISVIWQELTVRIVKYSVAFFVFHKHEIVLCVIETKQGFDCVIVAQKVFKRFKLSSKYGLMDKVTLSEALNLW